MQKFAAKFSCEPAVGEEIIPAGTPVTDTARVLSAQKAKEVYDRHRGEDVTVIGSDTIVVCDGKIYGKPKDEEDAKRMLRELSGKTHQVLTGVTILSGDFEESFTSATDVTFFPLSDAQIDAYVATGEPMDKAGAYGIQGRASLFVEGIRGDYFTVMGLPLCRLGQMLREVGVELL